MMAQDFIYYSIKNLREWRLRSLLTIIGVVVGVVAMLIITSVAEGSTNEVEKLLTTFGLDKIIIIPFNIEKGGITPDIGAIQRPVSRLTQKDVDSVKSITGVKMTDRVVSGRPTLKFKDKELTAFVYGADSDIFSLFKDFYKIEKGRAYTEVEKRVVVLGSSVSDEVFGKNKVDVGNVILINNREFKVVGIMEKTGGALSTHDDIAIYIPFEDGKELFDVELAKDEVSTIYVSLEGGYEARDIKAEIEQKIASNHKVSMDDKDFSVLTADLVQRTISNIVELLSRLLAAITAIAVVVGGVGISNTMFMAVTERTRIIGILKSMGASELDIQLLFLTESIMIGVLSGLIGFGIALVVLLLAGGFGVPYAISPLWVAFVLLFSAGVGLISGYIPSRRASKMKPVEAIRFI